MDWVSGTGVTFAAAGLVAGNAYLCLAANGATYRSVPFNAPALILVEDLLPITTANLNNTGLMKQTGSAYGLLLNISIPRIPLSHASFIETLILTMSYSSGNDRLSISPNPVTWDPTTAATWKTVWLVGLKPAPPGTISFSISGTSLEYVRAIGGINEIQVNSFFQFTPSIPKVMFINPNNLISFTVGATQSPEVSGSVQLLPHFTVDGTVGYSDSFITVPPIIFTFGNPKVTTINIQANFVSHVPMSAQP